MLINGSPLNGVVLGGGPRRFVSAAPVEIVPRQSIQWDVRVMIDGENVSELLTGQIRVDLERDGAALAEFTVLLNPGPVNPLAYMGKACQVYYRDFLAGSWTEELLFDGWVIRPEFEPSDRLIRCDCSDRLQDLLEAMTVEQIDALVGGLWSEDLFEPAAGRNRWDYAQERKSTRPYSLQKRPGGAIEMLPIAGAAPAFVMGEGVTMDRTLAWAPVELSERVNVVELVADYRYAKLRERHQQFIWEHPAVAGQSEIDGFCIVYGNLGSTEVPDIEMIVSETESAGYQAVLQGADWYRVPGSGAGSLCDPPFGWTNTYPDLLLGANWRGAMRWVQTVTERYSIRIEAPASIAASGEVLQRDQLAADSSDVPRVSEWESATFTVQDPDAVEDALGDWVVDLREVDRWSAALQCALSIHRTTLLRAHRENRLSFQMPTSDVMGLQLRHTVLVEDQRVRCQAPVWALIHELDIDEQTALTTIQLAVSQGGGDITDPLVMPPVPPSTPAGTPGSAITLATQLQLREGGVVYDPDLDGFSGNYGGVVNDRFPRSMPLTAPEIPAEHRDEFIADAGEIIYRVAIPDDLLEFV